MTTITTGTRVGQAWSAAGRLALLSGLMLVSGVASAVLPPPPQRPGRALPSHAAAPTMPAHYFDTVRALHTPTPGKTAPLDASGRPKLVLHAVYLDESAELTASSDNGGFSGLDMARAAHMMRAPVRGEHAIEPRTVDYLYRIQRHFNAQEIRILSGFRLPTKTSSQGQHGRGRACDFVLPGTDDEDVARFARKLGFAGVGIYTVGSFLHVDARSHSYFWIDRSGPGHSSRERGVFLDDARKADEEARARGERPTFLASMSLDPVNDDDADDEQ